MTLLDKIVNRVKKILGVEKTTNPNSERYTFIGDSQTVRLQHIQEYKVWGLIADSDELDNFYKAREVGGYQKEPIYNYNKTRYFWSLSEKETQGMKKIHTGIAKSAITTLVNCLQDVKIDAGAYQDKWDKISEKNNFTVKLNQEARPITLAEGDGAWKFTFNSEISDTPLIQFYESQDVEFIEKCGVIIGIIYKDYYKYQGKNYVLLEIRRLENKNCIIEYELYKLEKNNEVTPVDLDKIPELCDLPEKGYIIEGINQLLGVPSIYFYDVLYKGRGLSVLSGKIDILDDMDMLASVESMTEQCSGPVEYYPVDLLKKDKNGRPELPKVFGRKFIKKPVVPNADGGEDGKIDTSAPQLNFAQYHDALVAKTDLFLSGILSPASMGLDISKKDNAEAQREKEKVTIMTRNNIMANEGQQLKQLVKICLMLQEYMDTGSISIRDYDISIKYNDFASPTFETMSQILTPMLNARAISKEMFVEKLYGDTLSDVEKAREMQAIEDGQQADELGDIFNEPNGNMGQSEPNEETAPEFAE